MPGTITTEPYRVPGGPVQLKVTFIAEDGKSRGSTYCDTQEEAEAWCETMRDAHDKPAHTAPVTRRPGKPDEDK
jgi:hypothetical protein